MKILNQVFFHIKIHFGFYGLLVNGPDRPPCTPPPPQEHMRPILFCSWDFQMAAIEISGITFSPITQFLG